MRPLSKTTKRRRILEELENALDNRNSSITSSDDDTDEILISDLSNNSSDYVEPLNIQHAAVTNNELIGHNITSEQSCSDISDTDYNIEQLERDLNIPNEMFEPADVQIAKWAINHKITNAATSDLLKILKRCYDSSLPIDARTLMKTDLSHTTIPLQNSYSFRATMSWTVVHFIKDNSVEVVPHFWYDSSTSLCAWPTENLSYCVENKVTPDNKKFKYFKARVFKGCEKIESLIEATKKCERAQYTSDVDGILEKKKKQRKKKIVKAAPSSDSSRSSESENDSDFPKYLSDTENVNTKNDDYKNKKHLNLSRKQKNVQSLYKKDNSVNLISGTKKTSSFSDEYHIGTDSTAILTDSSNMNIVKNAESFPKTTELLSSPLGYFSTKYQNDSPNQDDNSMFSPNIYENHSESPTGIHTNPTKSASKKLFNSPSNNNYIASPSSTVTLCSSHDKKSLSAVKSPIKNSQSRNGKKSNYKMSPLKKKLTHLKNLTDMDIKTLLKNQLILKYEVKSLNEKLDLVLKILERVEEGKSLQKDHEYEYSNLDCLFPIDSETDLISLDDQLKTDAVYREKMVKDLSFTGGSDIQHVVKRIMTKLFSDTLLKDYSFIGKGIHKKKCFADLIICKVIFESIRRIQKFANTSQQQIEDKLKCYLAQAPFRLKRNNISKNNNNTNNTTT
ncbi:hypothetical protein ACI65C_008325 [Semiaphis heraclei]